MVSTHLKNICQNGSLPQVGVKIENIWNHHLVYLIITCKGPTLYVFMKWNPLNLNFGFGHFGDRISPYKGLPFWGDLGWVIPLEDVLPWQRPQGQRPSRRSQSHWSDRRCPDFSVGQLFRENFSGDGGRFAKLAVFSYHWITLDKIVWNYVQLKNIKNQLIVTYLTQYMTLFFSEFAAPRSPDQLTSPHLSMWTSKYLDLGDVEGHTKQHMLGPPQKITTKTKREKTWKNYSGSTWATGNISKMVFAGIRLLWWIGIYIIIFNNSTIIRTWEGVYHTLNVNPLYQEPNIS